ncbi:MAG: magnesium chelatase subunit H [Chloroflexota bacterium]
MRFLFLTMDGNHGAALNEAAQQLNHDHDIDIHLSLFNATQLHGQDALKQLENEIQRADFIFGAMLFGEELVRPLENLLSDIDTPICVIISNPTLIRCTHLNDLSLQKSKEVNEPGLFKRWMNKIRPKGGHGEGKRQLTMLRNLGKIMKFIPGKMRDLHTYIAVHDYWTHASPENLKQMLAMFIDRYVTSYKEKLAFNDPVRYPDAAIYHPDAHEPFESVSAYQKWRSKRKQTKWKGSVGLLSLRTVILSNNTNHLDALIRSLEARGIEARTAYSAGLDFRPAIEHFYTDTDGFSSIDVLLNGAGFSLVGGMAESRPNEARESLEALDVAYLDMIPLAFQRVEEWQHDHTGLTPMQMAMNIAIPELDGATEPLVYGGPTHGSDKFVALQSQIDLLVRRIERRIRLSTKTNAEKRLSIVLFNFPPNLGNAGTAAYLDVFVSVHRLLNELKAQGYTVNVPDTPETLKKQIVDGNQMLYGTDGNVGANLSLDNYRRLFPTYHEIEKVWGEAPGELLTNGHEFHILGAQFGNIFIGLQPSFGYERDPMRLLMAKDATPHHGFAAFYTWIEHCFNADAVLHFGTHGALEFMPGKQAGMSSDCWSTRLLGSLPNYYYYSVNNPSEATIAKRRGAATLISYMVPPLQQAGLYKGLRLLKDSIDSYQQRATDELAEDIQTQAQKLGIIVEMNDISDDWESYISALAHELIEVEHRMIPMGLHVLGETTPEDELVDILALVATFTRVSLPKRRYNMSPLPQLIAEGLGWDYEDLRHAIKHDANAQSKWEKLNDITRQTMRLLVQAPVNSPRDMTTVDDYLHETANIQQGKLQPIWNYLNDLLNRLIDEQEIKGLLHALEGGYITPSPGNDVVRNAAVVPTGRNIHGLDPFNVPTPAAHVSGEQLMLEMLDRMERAKDGIPETIAIVLWGTDNLKSDCEGVAQVLALLGARAITDELGKVADVELIPLSETKRPRIDVVVTVSGIFRDLLSHQMQLIDKAVKLAAQADEPLEFNFVRKHSLEQAQQLSIPLDEAATRVFSNAPGNYGANVNHLVESSNWEDDSELDEAFIQRKSFAYGKHGEWHNAREIMELTLGTVDATFQNIDSFEMGISDIDHYYEYLGGVSKSVEKRRGKRPPIYVADAMSQGDRLTSLGKMVRLESRAKMLNPKWYEAMLKHGYEGVREIETRVSNTYGWSATADAVEDWVYQNVAETYLLDEEMRQRLAESNPHATAGITRRLLEAQARGYWDADENILDQLRAIYGNLEDQLEGIKS